LVQGVIDMATWCWNGIVLSAPAAHIAGAYFSVAGAALAAIAIGYYIGTRFVKMASCSELLQHRESDFRSVLHTRVRTELRLLIS
jgi:hypothetical protein